MDLHGMSFVRAEGRVKGIAEILTSAACEWFLIFLLLIDSVFSFLVTKFARYCDLQIPCILCSRLDHVLGNEKPEFYRNLLCNDHRSEISSLISCHKHGKLAVGHGMCDDCLLSFSTKCHSNPDMHRLSLGKLGFDPVSRSPQSSFPNGDFTPICMSSRWCSCCSKPWKLRQNVQRLIQQKLPATRVIKSNIPLPHRVNHREGTKKIRSKTCGSAVTPHRVRKSGSDPLPHVGYSELKTASDSESEFMFSKEGNGSSLICDINEAKDDVGKPRDTKHLTPNASSWYGLSELNWHQPNQKTCSLPELIVLEDFSSPANTPELSGSISPISHILNPSTSTEPLSLDYFGAPAGASQENSIATGTTDTANVAINQHEEILELLNTTAKAIKIDPVHDNPAPVDLIYEDSSDVSKFVACGKGVGTPEVGAEEPIEKEVDRVRDTLHLFPAQNSSAQGINLSDNNRSTNVLGGDSSGFVAEVPIEKDVDRVGDALNLLPTQNSSVEGSNLSENNKGASVQGCGDEYQVSNDVTSNGFQTPKMSVPVERTQSIDLESLDGSSVSEIEGESTIERLKRQVQYDRRCVNELYKELDEERSAATIAANEAMAMITRLQEEKSALHMDALQYLRMMEEQAEYDMEELEKANDLVAEKEKQIQDLEAELEYYRLKYPNELMGIITEEYLEKRYAENMNSDHIKVGVNVLSDLTNSKISIGIDKHNVLISSLSEFSDEKLYIMQCLESLEKRLQIFARDMSNGRCNEDEAARLRNQGEVSAKEGSVLSSHAEDNDYPLRKVSVSNGILPVQENNLVANGKKDFTDCRNIDLVSLENEISDLNERLEALEEDYNILEHTSDLLQNGNEGLVFIQQIAHQLQEIRNIGIRCRCHSGP